MSLNQERWKFSSTPIVLGNFCVLFTWIQESKHKILVQTCGEVPLLSRYQKFEFSLNIQTKFVNNCNEILNVAIDVEQTFKCVGFRVGSLFTIINCTRPWTKIFTMKQLNCRQNYLKNLWNRCWKSFRKKVKNKGLKKIFSLKLSEWLLLTINLSSISPINASKYKVSWWVQKLLKKNLAWGNFIPKKRWKTTFGFLF